MMATLLDTKESKEVNDYIKNVGGVDCRQI